MFSSKKTYTQIQIRPDDLEKVQEAIHASNPRRRGLDLPIPQRQITLIPRTDHFIKRRKQAAGHLCVHED